MISDAQAALDCDEAERRKAYKFYRYFPDCVDGCIKTSKLAKDHKGYCRDVYVRSLAFMRAGAVVDQDGDYLYRERMFLAANRIGKTETASYEVTCHLTGRYPGWWEGRRFLTPTRIWAAGDTMLSTRDILQTSLFGPITGVSAKDWTGMIPAHLVKDTSRRSGGVDDCLETAAIEHVSGGLSTLNFKSFDQGRRLFQGTELELIWLDEEPPQDVYTECLTRTLTTKGMILSTFTPLQGLTPYLEQYLATAVMEDTHEPGSFKPANDVFWPAKAA